MWVSEDELRCKYEIGVDGNNVVWIEMCWHGSIRVGVSGYDSGI